MSERAIRKLSNVILLVAIAITFPGALQGSEPETYEDCLLKHLPGTESDLAAEFIVYACGRKFNPWSSYTKEPAPQAPDQKDKWWLDSPPVTDPDLLKELNQAN